MNPPSGGPIMSIEDDRTFHLERAAQCRRMAEEATDQSVRNLHEQLARFHEAEARREAPQLADEEGRA